jgi:hypothetical protein
MKSLLILELIARSLTTTPSPVEQFYELSLSKQQAIMQLVEMSPAERCNSQLLDSEERYELATQELAETFQTIETSRDACNQLQKYLGDLGEALEDAKGECEPYLRYGKRIPESSFQRYQTLIVFNKKAKLKFEENIINCKKRFKNQRPMSKIN